MKNLLIASILIAVSSIQAGTLKLPGANVTRNAGTSIPVLVQASGFPAGSKAQISLVNAKTWISTPWLFDIPVVNGNNTIQIPIDWSFWEVGNYLVKVNIANNHCTSTWLAKIRSAIIWPYAGAVFTRGQASSVTWTPSFFGDVISIGLVSEPPGLFTGLNAYEQWWFDPSDYRFDFIMPTDVVPGSYRFHITFSVGWWLWSEDLENLDDMEWYSEQTDETQSEKITIR